MNKQIIIEKCQNNFRPREPQYKKKYNYWNPANSPTQQVSRKDYFYYLLCSLQKKIKAKKHKIDWVLSREEALSQLNRNNESDSLTWLGHASFLIKLDGINILCDPLMGKRASPLRGIGPKRVVKGGLEIEDLPKIDVILITHNHYDHLCTFTLKKLNTNLDTIVVVPLGLAKQIINLGYKNVYEIDWMDTIVLPKLKIQALPAIHWSKRLFQSINKTLWCGFSLESSKQRIYIAGDTAYGPIFKELNKLIAPFSYSLLPIGAYEPLNIMRAHHVSPEEAVKIGIDLNSECIVAKHWGTLELTYEPLDEPPQRFHSEALKTGFSPSNIWIMKIGQTRYLQGKD